jgi:glycine cleavage system H protein
MSLVPGELRYVDSDEWILVDGDTVTIGVTDFAQSELGDITYVQLPEPGRVLQQGENFGSLESVKTVADLFAPVSGEVVAANPVVVAQTDLVNSEPYGQGWLIKVKLSNASEIEGLLTAEAYAAYRS